MIPLQVATVFLVAVAMALSLAHALEYPGKMRLGKEAYFAAQSIYYPGFTIGGLGEVLGLATTLFLFFLTPPRSAAFWWTLVSLIALAAMHAVFWTVTQPVNRHWLAGFPMSDASRRFFSMDPSPGAASGQSLSWERLRDRWEYSHIARAILAAVSLISLTIAVAVYRES